MNFTQKGTLVSHIHDILRFYYPACIDQKNGGYRSGFSDDGTVTDSQTKHLVGTSRFVYLFSIGVLTDGPDWCRDAAEHGIRFLTEHHQDKENGGFFFELDGTYVQDDTKMAYGHAFVLLAASIAHQAGVPGAKELLEIVDEVTEQHFWDEEHGLYHDEWDASWSVLAAYRGQNANMHMCEAMLTAYEATGENKYLDRAYLLAKKVPIELRTKGGGMIWEHYTPDWQPDWVYNQGNTKDEFRPYGFIPGHQLEWSKLLLWLDRHRSESWMLETAENLYRNGWGYGHDAEHGGIYYSLSPEREVIDTDKNYWVISEAISAAALLGVKTGHDPYWDHYRQLFTYASEYFIDHIHGGWYTLLNEQNERYEGEKSVAPKADYHPAAACYQTILALS
jgi:mannose/cellobiose epimerase-like protein (N-acyl-D-glucosamine 2-epimerase family)